MAEPGAEGLDCCQAAAMRGFPNSLCPVPSQCQHFVFLTQNSPCLCCSEGRLHSSTLSSWGSGMATLSSRECHGNPALLTPPPPPHGINSSTVSNNTARPKQAAGSVCKSRTDRKHSVCKELLPVPSLSMSLGKLPPPPFPLPPCAGGTSETAQRNPNPALNSFFFMFCCKAQPANK